MVLSDGFPFLHKAAVFLGLQYLEPQRWHVSVISSPCVILKHSMVLVVLMCMMELQCEGRIGEKSLMGDS